MTQKEASKELLEMIKAAASSLVSFKELWGSIKSKGEAEGFSEQELQSMLKPFLKDKLSPNQVKYLTHTEYYKEKSKEQYSTRKTGNITHNDDKKDIEQKPPTPVVTPPKEKEEDYSAEFEEWKKNNPPPQDPTITKVQSVGALPPQETLSKEDKDINTVVYRLGLGNHATSAQSIDDKLAKFGGYIKKDLPMLKQRGWKVVEVTIRVVS